MKPMKCAVGSCSNPAAPGSAWCINPAFCGTRGLTLKERIVVNLTNIQFLMFAKDIAEQKLHFVELAANYAKTRNPSAGWLERIDDAIARFDRAIDGVLK